MKEKSKRSVLGMKCATEEGWGVTAWKDMKGLTEAEVAENRLTKGS